MPCLITYNGGLSARARRVRCSCGCVCSETAGRRGGSIRQRWQGGGHLNNGRLKVCRLFRQLTAAGCSTSAPSRCQPDRSRHAPPTSNLPSPAKSAWEFTPGVNATPDGLTAPIPNMSVLKAGARHHWGCWGRIPTWHLAHAHGLHARLTEKPQSRPPTATCRPAAPATRPEAPNVPVPAPAPAAAAPPAPPLFSITCDLATARTSANCTSLA